MKEIAQRGTVSYHQEQARVYARRCLLSSLGTVGTFGLAIATKNEVVTGISVASAITTTMLFAFHASNYDYAHELTETNFHRLTEENP